MLISWILSYFVLSIVVTFCSVIFRRRLKVFFWLLIVLVWFPFLVVVCFGLYALAMEAFRGWVLEGYKPSADIELKLNSYFSEGDDEVFSKHEQQLCIYPSYDMREVVGGDLIPVKNKLQLEDFPAEDGLWYAIFLSGSEVSRIYTFSPRGLVSGCYQKKINF
jgi:hypothetical protein